MKQEYIFLSIVYRIAHHRNCICTYPYKFNIFKYKIDGPSLKIRALYNRIEQ